MRASSLPGSSAGKSRKSAGPVHAFGVPATILLPDYTGRLGNRLILFTHVLAAAMEHGFRVWNWSLLPAAHYFQGTHLNPLASYPRRHFPLDLRWLVRPFRRGVEEWIRGCRRGRREGSRLCLVLDRENRPNLDLASETFARMVSDYPWMVLWGYSFRCPSLVEKHAKKIRRFLAVRPEFAPAGGLRLGRNPAGRRIVVHLRQGDFKTWQGGKHYRSPKTMAVALAALRPDRRDRVWICSDEAVPARFFPPSADGRPRSLGEDLWLLTHATDVVSGTSTLAAWAAFEGKARHWLVDRRGRLHRRKGSAFATDH